MSTVYMARQPIFDKEMNIFGYELLYRKSNNNYFEDTDDDIATASLLDNFFLSEFNELVGDKRGFVNFSGKLILDKVPQLIPKEILVVEILERVEITFEVIDACKRLKSAGYKIALDDFILEERDTRYTDIIDLVDIIKVEYSPDTMLEQLKLIKQYGDRITFLAEKVETRADYINARKLGYSLFQGYFFSKPVMFNAKEIKTIPENLIMILTELNNNEVDYDKISNIFKHDIGLTYKLLKRVNSVYYGATHEIISIHRALVHMGTIELKRWVNVMIIKGFSDRENAELVNTSLVRGKFLSLYAIENGLLDLEPDYYISGIFSSIDILLNEPMEELTHRLSLNQNVRNTLLGHDTPIKSVLDSILALEHAQWDKVDNFIQSSPIDRDCYMDLYRDAIVWQRTMQ